MVEPSTTDATPAPPPLRRLRRRLVLAVVLLLALLVALELFARFYLGLGDPPLMVEDPQIEYLFKPSQEVRRFGKRVIYNAWSMRAEDFPKHKTDPDELRVMVIGDSVVNGGALTDHRDVATTRLQQRLRETLGRPVIVGNISAGSWGPVNMLEYMKRFGLFDADVWVIVLSSHDYADAPAYEPVVGVHPSFPGRKPVLAMQEAVTRYLLPRLFGASADASVPSDRPPEQNDIDVSLSAVGEMIRLAQGGGADVIVAQYWDLDEMTGPLGEGHGLIQQVALSAGAEVMQFGPAFQHAMAGGQQPFRDVIHPSQTGQRIMFEVLLPRVLELLEARISPATRAALDTPALAR